LLAGVPEARAEDCLAALLAAGYAASRVGQAEARRLDVPRLRLGTGSQDAAWVTGAEGAA
jgi:hypothetical protein